MAHSSKYPYNTGGGFILIKVYMCFMIHNRKAEVLMVNINAELTTFSVNSAVSLSQSTI